MSTLERRCWLLLTAYPAEYRRQRGEEILGTLLETTPQGRAWPLARDVLALVIGGLRARAAANRRLGTAADIRLGVLLGVVIELSAVAAGFIQDFATSSAVLSTAHDTAASGWRALLAGLLIAAAVTCAWRGYRRLLGACAPAAAAAVIWLLIHQPAYNSASMSVWTLSVGGALSLLLGLAALILLVRQAERPSRSWLWLIGLIVAAVVLQGLIPGPVSALILFVGHLLTLSSPWQGLLIMLIVPIAWTIAWIGVDARPALGAATFLALYVVTMLGDTIELGSGNYPPAPRFLVLAEAWWPLFAISLAVGGLAIWRLRRRQAVH
jgi:hypothetical protein